MNMVIILRGNLHVLGGGGSNSSTVWSETSGWASSQDFPLVWMLIVTMITMLIVTMITMIWMMIVTMVWKFSIITRLTAKRSPLMVAAPNFHLIKSFFLVEELVQHVLLFMTPTQVCFWESFEGNIFFIVFSHLVTSGRHVSGEIEPWLCQLFQSRTRVAFPNIRITSNYIKTHIIIIIIYYYLTYLSQEGQLRVLVAGGWAGGDLASAEVFLLFTIGLFVVFC